MTYVDQFTVLADNIVELFITCYLHDPRNGRVCCDLESHIICT